MLNWLPRPLRLPYGSRLGMVTGLMLYVLEGIQSIILIPFFAAVLDHGQAAFWVTLTTSTGLVAMALAGHYQPLIRNLSSHHGQSLPPNWGRVRGRTIGQAGVILLGAQVLFIGYSLHGKADATPDMLWAALLYFAGLHLRLAATADFILLNGMQQVGRDKSLLIASSSLNLVVVVGLGLAFRSVVPLAIGYVVVNGVLFAMARRAAQEVCRTHPLAEPSIKMPAASESTWLLSLSLGGYLNLSTDILLSSRLLHSSLALDYAFWSRILLTQLAVVGLWAQVRFPFWSSPRLDTNQLVRDVANAGKVLVAIDMTILAGYAIAASRGWLVYHAGLPIWAMAVMAATVCLAGLTVLMGQALTARSRYSFVAPSIVVSCLSPVAAWLAGTQFASLAFVLGYLAGNGALFAITLWCFRKDMK